MEICIHIGHGLPETRSDIHDKIQAMNIWPSMYDGRAVINTSYHEVLHRTRPIANITQEAKKAALEVDTSKMIIWA
jgi:hypothetical protein